MPRARGKPDFEVEHTGTVQRQKWEELVASVKTDKRFSTWHMIDG